MVKIEVNKLRDYLDVVTLKGKITEILVNFKEEGVYTNSTLGNNLGATFCFLDKKAFEVYPAEEVSIGIKDTPLLMNILSTFEGFIQLDISDNVLKIYNEQKVAHTILMKKEFVSTVFAEENKQSLFEKFDKGVSLGSNIFRNSVNNSSVLNSDSFALTSTSNLLIISTGDANFDKIEEKTKCDYKDFTAKYDIILKSIIAVIPDTINFSIIGDNAPCMFAFENDYMKCEILVAPLAE